MKKTVCGALVAIIGLVFSVIFMVYAMQNPWDYNGISGLLGSLLGTRTLIPFIVSLAVMVFGVVYCFLCAYKEDR